MSNVIIGIIGVILFIGLAIAGSTFIGPLITESGAQKNAAVVLNSLSQTAAAARIYKVRTGKYVPITVTNISMLSLSIDTLVSSGMLSARPENPFVPEYIPILVNEYGGATVGTPSYVLMWLGDSEQAMKACIEIELQSNRTDRLNPAVMSQPISFLSRARMDGPGCHKNTNGFGGVGGRPREYLAYFPI